MGKAYKTYKNKAEVEADYDNFKQDWEIDAGQCMARHKSGVELYAIKEREENGRKRLQIHREFAIGEEFPDLNSKELPKFFAYLNAQFMVLYERDMPKAEEKEITEEDRRKNMEERDKFKVETLREEGYPEEQVKRYEQYLKSTLEERLNMGRKR